MRALRLPASELLAPRRRGPATALRLVPEIDPALGEIVGRHLHRHPVAGERADMVLTHLAAGIGEDLVVVIQPHPIVPVREHLGYDAFEFEEFFLCHGRSFPPRRLQPCGPDRPAAERVCSVPRALGA